MRILPLLEVIFLIILMMAVEQLAWGALGLSLADGIAPLDLLQLKFVQVPILLLVIGGVLRFHREPFLALGLRRPPNGWLAGLGLGAAATLPLLVVSYAVAFLAHFLFPAETPEPFDLQSQWALPAFLLVGILAGGIGEEIQFRGFVFQRLERFFQPWGESRATLRAALTTSLVFASLHLYEGPVAVLAIFVVALGLQYLCLAAGRNLLACMVCHSLFNSVQIVAMFAAAQT